MTENQQTIAIAFIESLFDYQIFLSIEDAHDVCHVRLRWQACMTWLAALEQWLSFGQTFRRPPECLVKFLSNDQRTGVRESYLPAKKVTPKPLPIQLSLFGD